MPADDALEILSIWPSSPSSKIVNSPKLLFCETKLILIILFSSFTQKPFDSPIDSKLYLFFVLNWSASLSIGGERYSPRLMVKKHKIRPANNVDKDTLKKEKPDDRITVISLFLLKLPRPIKLPIKTIIGIS